MDSIKLDQDDKMKNLKMKERQVTIGSWVTLAHPAIAEIMANAAFDWLGSGKQLVQ